MFSNGLLAELMAVAAEQQEPGSNRQKALQRAARRAIFWPEEAQSLVEAGRSLTELSGVGPWLARLLAEWLDGVVPLEVPEPPEVRRGFMTLAEVRAILAGDPSWPAGLQADLQMHTTYSDGSVPLRDMVNAAAALGYGHVNITDHSVGLKIARGMSHQELDEQAHDIAGLNRELEGSGERIRVLHGLEMNLSPEGEGDMDPKALARLDLVLGAFHSKLRVTEDQTARYLAALRNPTFHVLAHPRGRMFNRRAGLRADWPRVFDEAVAQGKAVEIDANPNRQDLDVELLKLAREAGVWISMGTDSHSVGELLFMEFGLAAAVRAEVPKDRILNFMTRDELLEWAARPARVSG